MNKDKLINTHESKIININGHDREIDIKLIPLIKELNKVGLVTRSCCQGDSNITTYITLISNNNNLEIKEILDYKGRKQFQICWDMKS